MLRLALLTAALLFLTSCAGPERPSITEGQAQVDLDLLQTLPDEPIDFASEVRPILENRCIVCHGCYDAPCQLKLSSPEGIERGGSKVRVYDGSRIRAIDPTRLFIDAQTTAEWRDKGFHPVLNEGDPTAAENLSKSILYRMLRLKQRHPQPRVGMLPDDMNIDLDRPQSCPTIDEFDQFAAEHPTWGMPYAMPNLEDDEYRTLVYWLAQGAQTPDPLQPSSQAVSQIERWEAFLNAPDLKSQLTSRYLYEHLFLAHIHLEGTDDREFYRLIRSSTPPGQPARVLATVRPYYAPEAPGFWYRLVRHQPSIVAKNHLVYEWSDTRMDRYRTLFLEPDYTVTELPTYALPDSANPFKTFAPIPPISRYRFLLDDARFFIEGFMKGPVCRGQVALNVIEDHFWVLFFDPDRHIFTQDPDFLDRLSETLAIPSGLGDDGLNLFAIWNDFGRRQAEYLETKSAYFAEVQETDLANAVGYVWDGGGENPNAALTIFRHFDSASVSLGLVGDEPDTAWIIDYPLFERIHYLLVAGYNVFGNVGHGLNTRLFMDFLRMEGENHFLSFLPASHRAEIRSSWYNGVREGRDTWFAESLDWLQVESVTGYQTDDPQSELYRALEDHLGRLAALDGDLDRCDVTDCSDRGASPNEQTIDRAMARIAAIGGEHLVVFPDVTFVRVRDETGDGYAYTLIRNKAYKNVTSMLADANTRDREDTENDTLTVVEWLEGSYPNFFFDVQLDDIDAFAKEYAAIRERPDYEEFVARYGIRRTDPRFWEVADWFQARYAKHQPRLAGLFDLNRYRNR